MNKKALIVTVIGAVFTAGVGSLLHFLFEWCDGNSIAALFSAVNESTWEHLKLFYIPFFFFTFIEYFISGNGFDNFFTVKLLSALAGMGSIVVIYYTYVGIVGKNIDWVNIVIFMLAVAISYALSYILTVKSPIESSPRLEKVSVGIMFGICALFFIFTYYTPRIGLFKDPTTSTYGIVKK